MWSRKRRKKEAKGSGGGGAVVQGKEGSSRSSSVPPAQPSSPRTSRSNKPTPTAHPQAHTSLTSSPPPPPPPTTTTPSAVCVEPRPLLANPNLKPALTVPLPAAPINPAAILDSLKSSLQHEAATVPLPPASHPAPTHSLSNTAVALATVGMGSAPVITSTNSMSSIPLSGTAGSSSVAVAQQQSDHLQKVIEAQRTQLDLLSQITKTLTDQQHLNPYATNTTRRPGEVTGGNRPHPLPPSLPPQGPVSSRLQTFDYGNRSSTELQSLAIKHLEQEYSVRGSWP